jgi:hypothetical protein
VQIEAQSALAHHPKKIWLNLFKFSDVRQASNGVKQWHLTGHFHFAAFLNPSNAKGQLLLVALFDQMKVAHFKYLKWQHAIGKQTVGQGKKGNGVLHLNEDEFFYQHYLNTPSLLRSK